MDRYDAGLRADAEHHPARGRAPAHAAGARHHQRSVCPLYSDLNDHVIAAFLQMDINSSFCPQVVRCLG